MLDDNELLFDELYEKTKDFGRVQFINLLMAKEREIQELKKQYCERTDCSGRIGNSKKLEMLEMENKNLRRTIKKLLNNEDIGTGLMNTLYGYGLFNKQDNN